VLSFVSEDDDDPLIVTWSSYWPRKLVGRCLLSWRRYALCAGILSHSCSGLSH